jgi:hypothetical protein
MRIHGIISTVLAALATVLPGLIFALMPGAYAAQGEAVAAEITPVVAAENDPALVQARLLSDLQALTTSEMAGRGLGTAGERAAAEFVAARFEALGLQPFGPDGTFFQDVPLPSQVNSGQQARNVVAVLAGEQSPYEFVVVSAHLDHLGRERGRIHPGADDNASGVSAMLEIAHALVQDTIAGNRPARSVIFVGFTAEEVGLRGSQYFVEHAPVHLASISAVLNIDMVGRRDDRHRRDDPYIYMIGTRLHSQMLGDLVDASAENSDHLDVDFHFNSRRRQMAFYQRSDQWHFARYGVPALMAFAGAHPDYHTHRDVVEDIELDLLTPRVLYLTGLTRELANTEEPMVRDRAVEAAE